jgi:hypothetical protein
MEVVPEDVVSFQRENLEEQQVDFGLEEQEDSEGEEEDWPPWPSGLQEGEVCIKQDSGLQGKYGRELDVAVQAIQLACVLSQRVQERLLDNEEVAGSKNDESLVTVAGTQDLCNTFSCCRSWHGWCLLSIFPSV